MLGGGHLHGREGQGCYPHVTQPGQGRRLALTQNIQTTSEPKILFLKVALLLQIHHHDNY